MKFKVEQEGYYDEYYVNEDDTFAIGVNRELFNRWKIQVMEIDKRSGSLDGSNGKGFRYKHNVIQEIVSYKRELIDERLVEIMKRLALVSGLADWGTVKDMLPKIRGRYLELQDEEAHKPKTSIKTLKKNA